MTIKSSNISLETNSSVLFGFMLMLLWSSVECVCSLSRIEYFSQSDLTIYFEWILESADPSRRTLALESNGDVLIIPTSVNDLLYYEIVSKNVVKIKSITSGYLDCRYRSTLITVPIFSEDTGLFETVECGSNSFLRCLNSSIIVSYEEIGSDVLVSMVDNYQLYPVEASVAVNYWEITLPPNCLSFNDRTAYCVLCAFPGYILNSSGLCDPTSLPFPVNSIAIDSSGLPVMCSTGYILSNSGQPDANCETFKCLDPNALTCSSPINSTSCKTNFEVFEGVCLSPDQCKDYHCEECLNKYICTKCKTPYYLNDTKCYNSNHPYKCLVNILPDECLKCDQGHYIEEGSCILRECTSDRCQFCSESSTKCDTCYPD